MKIGDRIIIDKEYYLQKYKETFGDDIQIDGLTNDKRISTYLHKSIKDHKEFLITDITAEHHNNEMKLIIHLIDDENHDGSILYSFIKDDTNEKYTKNGIFDYYQCGLDIIKNKNNKI